MVITVAKEITEQHFIDFWEKLPEHERLIVDVLRQIVIENLPATCREKFAYRVPFYYGKKRICCIWPGSVPRGGFSSGVLLGFIQGYKLKNLRGYITNGTNKQVYYRIIHSVDEIDEKIIVLLLKEALEIDAGK